MRITRAVTGYVSRYRRWRLALAIAVPYALLVVGVTVYVEIGIRQPGSQGLEAVLLFLVTAPISLVLLQLPLEALGADLALLLFFAAGLFQAWILWMIAHGPRKDGEPAVVHDS
ncbi:hypothetical protein AB0M95_02110 [Sphaerisporangium sp. NPDC051017]|uniref:SCO4225 family membrane protein n=1 Tax=Sphaerisporangium sp. NPDC051017 TaxID=3154636 RepID=UPI00344A1908